VVSQGYKILFKKINSRLTWIFLNLNTVALNGAECDLTAIAPVLCDESANLVCSADAEAGTCQCDPTALVYWNPTTVTCAPGKK